MNEQRKNLARHLFSLEKELRALRLWQTDAPSTQALASTQPFCLDSLEFHQWLQFVFVKKLQAALISGAPLPERCEITPYAEEYYRGSDLPVDSLMHCLLQIDGLFPSSARS